MAAADAAVAVDAAAVVDAAVPVPTVVGAADNDIENCPCFFLCASAFLFFRKMGRRTAAKSRSSDTKVLRIGYR